MLDDIQDVTKGIGDVGSQFVKGNTSKADIYVDVSRNSITNKAEIVPLAPRVLTSSEDKRYSFGIYAKDGQKNGELIETGGLTFQANCPKKGRKPALATVQTVFNKEDLVAAAFADINGDGFADAILKYKHGVAVFLSTKCG